MLIGHLYSASCLGDVSSSYVHEGFSFSSLVCKCRTRFWGCLYQGHKLSCESIKSREEIYGWHIGNSKINRQTLITWTYKWHLPMHTVHSIRHKSWWVHSIPGHLGDARTSQIPITQQCTDARPLIHTSKMQWDSHNNLVAKCSVINTWHTEPVHSSWKRKMIILEKPCRSASTQEQVQNRAETKTNKPGRPTYGSSNTRNNSSHYTK